MADLYIDGDWLAPYISPAPFETLLHDTLAEILSHLQPSEIAAFSQTCKPMARMLHKCLELVLCQVASRGDLPLTYVVEHIPLIHRVRVYNPDFVPFPGDYTPEPIVEEVYESEDSYDMYDGISSDEEDNEVDPLRY